MLGAVAVMFAQTMDSSLGAVHEERMQEFEETKALLDQINDAIESYDPVLKEKARDILIQTMFNGRGGSHGHPGVGIAGTGAGAAPPGGGFGTLLRRWTPRRASERALLGAYFLTRVQGETMLTSQAINGELKAHGVSVSNITRAMDSNLRAKPPLMVQVKKMGKTRQARKQYQMTPAGIESVERQLEA